MKQYNITTTKQARENGAKTNRETLKAYLRENGRKTCKEIAEDCGTTSRAVLGTITNCQHEEGYYNCGIKVCGKKTIVRRFVELNEDGSINPDKIIAVGYKVNVYAMR